MPDPARQIPSNKLRSRFELLEVYTGGEGWSGHVRDGSQDRVLKILAKDEHSPEASLLASLQHPCIPNILEVGQCDAGPYLLREYVAGTPLSDLDPLTPQELIDLAEQILEVLAYVHLRGILHLDIKPGNVVRRQGAPAEYVLLDFGLGTRAGQKAGGGTPFYAAPEQLLGAGTDGRSDLFSLGALLFAAQRCSRTPLPVARVLQCFPHQDFLTAAGANNECLPAPFDTWLPRLLARNPGQRFLDAQEALEALTGGGGRPSPSLLYPDPIEMFGSGLEATLAKLAPGTDLRLRGGEPEDRRRLAIHVAAQLGDVRDVTVGEDGYQLHRGNGEAVTFELLRLDRAQIAQHLGSALGLSAQQAESAANSLQGVDTCGGLAHCLVDLVTAGQVVPDGTRWIWPDAIARRTDRIATAAIGPDPDAIRTAAARGQVWSATLAYTRAQPELNPKRDREMRAALAEGLLACGEPARCLAFVADLPVHRARALYELGQPERAEALLATFSSEEPEAHLAQPEQIARLSASIDYARGRYDMARDKLLALLAERDVPGARVILGLVEIAAGNHEKARQHLQSVLQSPDLEQQPLVHIAALTQMGELERQRGNPDRALELNREALDMSQALGHARHIATTSSNVGVSAKDAGHHQQAMDHLRRARRLFEHLGDRSSAALTHANLGVVSLESGDSHGARRRLQEALHQLDQLGNAQSRPLLLLLLARSHAALGDWDAADRCIEEAGSASNPRLRAELRRIAVMRAGTVLEEPGAAVTKAPAQNPESTMSSRSGDVPKEVFRTFLAINRRLAGEADLERAMDYLLDAAVTLCGGRSGNLLVSRPDGLRREFRAGDAPAGPNAFSRSLINRALQEKRILTGDDAQADRNLAEMPSVRNLERRSAMCVPFQCASGTTGAIYVEHPGRPGVFGDVERSHMEVLADQAAIAVDRMLHEEQLAKELELSRRDLKVAHRALGSTAKAAILGESAAMRSLQREIDKLAETNLAVLILGETGTGKDLVARAVHQRSSRSRAAFVAENCSAIPAELMESELFGHKKGAFTGADADRAGLFELASGGTLFLDEIGDMPQELQAKLLRALQEQQIRRIGDNEIIPVDIRLVTATHKNMQEQVRSQAFREDLYFRIAAVELQVPPLRERDGDVLLLAEEFLERFGREQGRRLELAPKAKEQLRQYRWPGNVRELQHVIARAGILADDDVIGGFDLPQSAAPVRGDGDQEQTPSLPRGWPAIPLAESEARTIRAALQATNGEKAKAARLLGISRTALYEKLKRIERQET